MTHPPFVVQPTTAEGDADLNGPGSEDQPSTRARELPPFNRTIVIVSAGTLAVLIAVSARYGYHRDELYFLAAGHHLAWGYPDQPPLVPLLARLLSAIDPGSVVALRLPSAVAAAATVTLTGLLARELGGRGPAQLLAAGAMATSALLYGADHYLNTAAFDLLAWTLLLWLIVRILRTQDQRLWLVVGVVAGVGLLNSDLVAFLLATVVVGIVIAGPRRVLSSPWLWAGGAIAAVMWAPYLVWQAQHGWPQLTVSRSIAAGSSGTSQPRIQLLPFQLVLISPYLAPVWIVGLLQLFRRSALRWCRAIAWAYPLLAVVFVATGGKSYYLAGMLPVLLAAGAQPTVDWVSRGRSSRRRAAVGTAVTLTAVGTVLATLPVLPVGALHRTPIVALNYDEGETVGWPTYVSQIAGVYHRLPPSQRPTTVILTSNYGESGAVEQFGPADGLPGVAFSGQNGFWYWGPPPTSARTYIAVGFSRSTLDRHFEECTPGVRLDNRLQIKNDEQGAPVRICTGLRGAWPTVWPQFQVLG
ncbi:MAG: glycosyltransferase family 39 protein [Acidimicrobiales bacterium]